MFHRRKEEEASTKANSDGNERSERWPDISTNEDLHVYFAPPGNYKMRLAMGSSDVLLRTGAARRGIQVHFFGAHREEYGHRVLIYPISNQFSNMHAVFEMDYAAHSWHPT